MGITWNELLEELIDEIDFKTSIEKNGFFNSNVSLQIFGEKYGFKPKNTASHLSINFWSEQ